MSYRSTRHNPPPEPERAAMTEEFREPSEVYREMLKETQDLMADLKAARGPLGGEAEPCAGNPLGGRATRPMYYHPDGLPIVDDELLPATLKWAMLMEQNRHVGSTKTIYGELLSTVWLGLDHNFSNSGPPIIFETMLFAPDPDDIRRRSATVLLARMKGEPADTSESERFEAHVKKNFPHDQLQLRYATRTEAEDEHEKLKLQCLIPPRWRHFLLWTIGRDRTWAHYDDEDDDEW